MCKKNVKWYLKDTKNEISLRDELTYHQTISFDKYPNLVFETTVTHPLDEEDLKILEESEIIEKKEIQETEPYTTYLKWLADVEGFTYSDVLKSFSTTLQINPNAALSMVLKAISKMMNKGCSNIPSKIWIYNLTNGKPAIIDVTTDTKLKDIAWFTNKENLDYALRVCAPLLKLTNK